MSSVGLAQRCTYVVVLEQELLGRTVSSEPHSTLESARAWLKAFGVFDDKDDLLGDVYSDGGAVIGRWEIRRVYGG